VTRSASISLTIENSSLTLGIQRHLALHTQSVARSMERLSSGLRINRAADDPAGLAIAERLRAREVSMGQAIKNAFDGVSMLQIGDGAMDEVNGLLIRLRELAVQSANGTLSAGERGVLDQEAQGLVAEIDRIAAVTSFNGVQLLDGTTGTVDLQTGPNASDTLSVTGVNVRASQLGSGGALTDIDITSQAGATAALDILDGAIGEVSQARGSFGTMQSRVESQIRSLQIAQENTAAARSRIMDADIAAESAALAKSLILQQVSVAMLAQANAQQGMVLKLLDATFR